MDTALENLVLTGTVDLRGTTKLAGTTLSTTATELNTLASVVAGVVTAGKAVVTTTDKTVDALKITSLTVPTVAGLTNFTTAPTGVQVGHDCCFTTITAMGGGTRVICIAPFNGTVVGVKAAVDNSFTSTDIVITTKINGTAVTDGAITIPTAGSAALSAGTATPTAANTFVVGDVINCTVTGGVGTCGGHLNVLLIRTS